MNMTVEEYTEYKLKQHLTDRQILVMKGYNENYTKIMQKWKREHGITPGTVKLGLLNKKQIRKELNTHSIRWASKKYNMDYGHFRKWVYTWIYEEE
jgi:hypothetical protein